MDALTTLHACYADPLRAARDWRAQNASQGGRIVGYLCDNVPTELIEAAGFLPLRITGDTSGTVDAVRRHVDRLYTPDVTTRPAFVDAFLQRLLDGSYDLIDYLVVPHNRHAIQSLYRELNALRAAEPARRVPTLFYLDKAWCPSQGAAQFDRDGVALLRDALQNWSGRTIDTARLAEVCTAAQEQRRLLRDVLRLREATPAQLRGVDALAILGSSQLMPRAQHVALLRELLREAKQTAPRPGKRVFVAGSPLDHPQVYAEIEDCGATVVGEDHCWGSRLADECGAPGTTLSGAGDPFTQLADAFHARSACSIVFPLATAVARSASRAAAVRPDAAIFYVMNEDWAHNWETPARVQRLESMGIACLVLAAQPYAPEANSLRERVTTFLAGVTR